MRTGCKIITAGGEKNSLIREGISLIVRNNRLRFKIGIAFPFIYVSGNSDTGHQTTCTGITPDAVRHRDNNYRQRGPARRY